jgi:hypothetical protein
VRSKHTLWLVVHRLSSGAPDWCKWGLSVFVNTLLIIVFFRSGPLWRV